MNNVVWYGYPLSGEPYRGLSLEGIVERAYTLYDGRYASKEVYGKTVTLRRPLSADEVAELSRQLNAVPTEIAGMTLAILGSRPEMPPTEESARAWVRANNPYMKW